MPAPTWVAHPVTSRGWLADCGEYIGTDWPPLPPTTLTPDGDDSMDEIDIHIGVPGGDPYIRDGSEPRAQGYIYDANDDPMSPDIQTDSEIFSPSTAFGTESAPLHLWVLVARRPGYDFSAPDPAPTWDARDVVPEGYVSLSDPEPPSAPVTAELFEPDGTSSLGDLANARGFRWNHTLSRRGSGSLEIPLADSLVSAIDGDCIVKYSWHGAVRFGVRLSGERCQLAKDGRRWLSLQEQPGLLSLLRDSAVMPEADLATTQSQERVFGFMSGGLTLDASWVAPDAADWGVSSDRHGVLPESFGTFDPTAQWIAASPGPNTTVPDGQIEYFRATVTLADDLDIIGQVAGDNFLSFWIDGEQFVAPDQDNYYSWRTASQFRCRLKAGTHTVAALVKNRPLLPIYTGLPNPVAFIMSMFATDSSGAATGSPLLNTNATDWLVSTGPALWSRGAILYQLLTEWQANGDKGASALTIGFTATQDSNGDPWTDSDQRSFPIATLPGDEVAMQLAENVIDVDVDADTMTINAWNRKGSDVSGSVALALGDADPDANLKTYETTRTYARKTVAIGQIQTGEWVEVEDSAGVSAYGRKVIGLALGSVTDITTAQGLLQAVLDESAGPHDEMSGQTSTLAGKVPYVDYDLGDSITVPGHRNSGDTKARALAFTVDATGDVVQAWPDLALDPS